PGGRRAGRAVLSIGNQFDGTGGRPDARIMHLDLAALEAGLGTILESPAEVGTVELIVRRPATDERETLQEAHIDLDGGLVGDRWRGSGSDRDHQITVMNARAVALVAGSPERWSLAGDQ